MTVTRRVEVRTGGHSRFHATLAVPKRSRGLVVIVRGAPGGIHGPSIGETVASVLERGGIATVLLDLLSPAEARDAGPDDERCLELEALANRLDLLTNALLNDPETQHLTVGYFGEGIGAPVSLLAAARHARTIRAVVACGALTALGEEDLRRIAAPTLLLVDPEEPLALELAGETLRHLEAERRLEVVPGIAVGSGDAEAAERVADLAAGWFVAHLAPTEHVWAEELGGWGP